MNVALRCPWCDCVLVVALPADAALFRDSESEIICRSERGRKTCGARVPLKTLYERRTVGIGFA